jgi:hypothetical protein
MEQNEELPKWLTAHMTQVAHVVENQVDLDPDPRFPMTADARKVRTHNLECLFERVLDVVCEGGILRDAVENDHNGFTAGEVLRWIRSNPERLERYREAQKINAELMSDETIKIADGDGLEDVQRSKLRIETRRSAIVVNNRERYGNETTSANPFAGGVTIVIGEVTPSPSRSIESRVIDHE